MKMHHSNQIKEDEMGRFMSCVGEIKNAYKFWLGNINEKNTWKAWV